ADDAETSLRAKRRRATFVHQGGERHTPAVVHLTNEVDARYVDILKEDLVELRFASHLPERPHGDPRAFHVHENVRHAPMFGRLRISAYQQHTPVSNLRQAGPYLLSIDNKFIAPELSLSAN